MNTDGAYEGQSLRADHVPRPAGPPGVPPKPTHAPGAGVGAGHGTAGAPLADWARTPRPKAEPGVWRFGYRPREGAEAEPASDRSLLSGAVISFLACVLLWSLLSNGYIPYATVPVKLFTPRDWWELGGAAKDGRGVAAEQVYMLLLTAALVVWFSRLGSWGLAFDRLVAARGPQARGVGAAAAALFVMMLIWTETLPVEGLAFGHLPHGMGAQWTLIVAVLLYLLIYGSVIVFFVRQARRPAMADTFQALRQAPPATPDDPVAFNELRGAGLGEVADRLGGEIGAGRMNDVDYARIRRAWESVRVDPSRARAFADAVLNNGAGACVHPSGARDLPVRAARHDLLTRQVLLGTVEDGERNPWARRGTALALDPEVLGTSLVAVGPSGSGKTRHLVRPVVEALALQALAGQAAVVAVGSAGARLGPDSAYDIVVRIGDPESVHDLDLYGGATDPDEAAGLLAEAFVGDVPGSEVRRAATALAQLLGPFHTAHGRFPSVPELRDLLDPAGDAVDALRRELEAAGQPAMLRELDARSRQRGAPGDPAPALADRLALLDRPAFHGFFDTSGQSRPFSVRAMEHPIRVRVDLPERGHAGASRMLARLLLAQFNASVAARTDRSLFAFLAFDDASHTLTPETVRGVQRLRSANAGVLLTLRTLDDVPDGLRTPLLGAVGCRMAFSGVTTWDGKRFAEAWGTEWVETRDVTHRTVFADQPLTRAIHAFRKLVTGKAVTTDAVTVRQVERERWSASDLAHAVPPDHAVLSLTSVRGERAAPLLVRLAGSS
ncbi:ATP/GTP-binding protein [Streptomyces sp. NBC_00513]|uniref:ATP/GTP-binding protein n=1 Tax=unclassified Streptomyces TaxID=2593676 RepID=UPI0022513FC1|nr:ATP/GTP-binding protein [Streptomyces sp. NBC_00424]MCX5073072.1 ATP/GTP-binding protein [Streptomyces sp. NBC_00424]WUD43640.1 ATP/GTP-binding protein [Streptomyces sp. NBC_00513]